MGRKKCTEDLTERQTCYGDKAECDQPQEHVNINSNKDWKDELLSHLL